MRLQLNLNKYYEGLEQESVNIIFSSMLNMKPYVDILETIYNLKRELTSDEEITKKLSELDIEVKVNELDLYMEEIGKKSIFGTRKEDELTEEQIKQIVEKYKFLMSKPNNT